MKEVFILLEINMHSVAEASALVSGFNDGTEFLVHKVWPVLHHGMLTLAGLKGAAFVAKHRKGNVK